MQKPKLEKVSQKGEPTTAAPIQPAQSCVVGPPPITGQYYCVNILGYDGNSSCSGTPTQTKQCIDGGVLQAPRGWCICWRPTESWELISYVSGPFATLDKCKTACGIS
jgi:hypothetical protein